ncbi:molybdopterin-dependent oxidoreductase [Burkholderia vietnamiensis]|uniref:molybdopterin-dependent oxidoreductase n=1 Tax=Burkholderia vietnamiensis TaxID=60552 RepID=UPI003809802B
MSATPVKSVCPYCGVGCGMVLHVEDDEVVKVSGDSEHPTNFGRLCTKGSSAHVALRRSGRLDRAFVRRAREDDLVPLPARDAIAETARRLRAVLDAHGPDALSFYVSGQMSIEAQYLVNKLAKGFVGTNNIESNSRLCMASASTGYKQSLGANGRTDAAFIDAHTEGWDAMPAFLADYTPERVAEITGLAPDDLRTAAQWIGDAPEWTSCWTMGLNQSTHGVWNTNAICNLHLATGKICRPGSGPFSLTGQPNAMGGREMGYMGAGLPGQRSVASDDDRRFVENLWRVPAGTLRQETGSGTVDLFERMAVGDIKACWIICTNPVATVPNRQNVIAGLQAAELVIAQDAFLDTETNRYADILLPGALWAEGDGVMVNSERNLTLMRAAVAPPGDALPDWRIVAEVARAMGFGAAFDYASAADVFDEIVRFSNPATGYDLRGASHAALRDGPVQWPVAPGAARERHPIRYLNDGVSQTLRPAADGGAAPRIAFPTPSGRARFFARPHVAPAELPDDTFPIVLNTGRLQHQWHTMTKTGKVAMLNKLNPRPFVELHPDDARALGIAAKDSVEIRSARGRAVLPAVVTERVLRGNCFAPMHWNDVYGDELCINAVTNDAIDAESQQPELKYCAVALTRADTNAFAPADDDTARLDAAAADAAHAAAAADAQAAPVSLAASQESDMADLDTFAAALGVADLAPPPLSDAERLYVAGLVGGLRASAGRRDGGVPVLPAGAPLTPPVRYWLDGMLAGLFSRSAPAPATERAAPALPADAAAPGGVRIVRTRPKVTLLWASQTGNIESLTEDYATQLMNAGFEIRTACMSDYPVASLASAQYVLLMTSTFGDGDAPDNGSEFWDALQAAGAPRVEGMQFAVLAFGDRNYDQFCGHGRRLDARLAELGATRLCARVDCDVEFQRDADQWLERVVARIKEADAALHAVPSAGASASGLLPSKAHPAPSKLVANLRLNRPGAAKDTRYVSLSTEGANLEYEAGDALGVWPTNCPELVDELLAVTALKADTPVSVAGVGDVRLADALARHFDITRPHPDTLAFIASRSANGALKALLGDDRKADLKQWLWGQQLADVLHEFPVELSGMELVGMLKRLQPRLYSIASSPSAHRGEIHLTVSAVRYHNGRRARKGVASTFLADRADDGRVPVFVQKSAHFRPPVNGDVPVVMVGPGTGVAPFRGFLHERQARGARGRNWLFFGEQHAQTDFYYGDELSAMRDSGFLTRLDLAFSRDQADKIYVQDRMREHGAELYSWLEDGAHFYVCGDAARMAKDVDTALKAVVAEHGGMSDEAANDYVARLAKARRYVRDVY